MLIVEDMKMAVRAAKYVLELLGFEVVHVETGEAAIEKCAVENFDFVLMDIGLGDGLSGDEATTKIREHVNEKNH